MEKMIADESNERLIALGMKALRDFFSLVYRLTGISATPSNFIVFW